MVKKKYWIRKLDCGHSRWTNLAFIAKKYDKPKVGDSCYCRTCFADVNVIGVKEASKEDYKEIRKWEKEFGKLAKKPSSKTEKVLK